MKVTKTQAVLSLYDSLLANQVVYKKDFLATIEISDISFKRYVSELRCYFANFAPNYDLHYSRKDDAYYLIISKFNG
jgi:hypothetical protein